MIDYLKDEYKYIYLFLIGLVVGYISWNLTWQTVAFSSLIYIAYFYFNSRKKLLFFSIGYRLASSYGIILGLINSQTSGFLIGFFLWILYALVTTLPFILFWSNSLKLRLILFIPAIIFTIFPPIGLVNGASPIVSAGIFFPDMGYWGIILYLISIVIIGFFGKIYFSPLIRWGLTVLLVIFIPYFYQEKREKFPFLLYPIQTSFNFQFDSSKAALQRIKALQKQINQSPHNLVLLPENIIGYYDNNHSNLLIWKKLKQNKHVLAGAHIYYPNNNYDNTLIFIDNNHFEVLYKQRFPVPIAMWKPFTESSANTNLLNSNITFMIKNYKVGVFICYEIYIPYFYLQTMYEKPDVIIGISNLWWNRTTHIINAQKFSLMLWCRLFSKPYVFSSNRTPS